LPKDGSISPSEKTALYPSDPVAMTYLLRMSFFAEVVVTPPAVASRSHSVVPV
jgi:hypothetical protein